MALLRHLQRVGALYLLAVLAVATTGLFWEANIEEARHEAEQHGQPFDPADARTAFWSKALENLQSEWWQLLVQSIITGAAVHVVFRKMTDDTEEIKQLLEKREKPPQKPDVG